MALVHWLAIPKASQESDELSGIYDVIQLSLREVQLVIRPHKPK
jgi:hypothetical protein